jgi:hypothetical protein
VNRVGGDDRAGWALVEADVAAAAVLVQWLIWFQVQIEQQLAEHDPRAMTGHDDAGVLAVPSEPGASGNRAIDDARVIGQEP